MKKEYIDFICSLHGYTIRIKEIHWSTKTDATHRICDEIEEELCEIEDRFAECAMGISGESFKMGDLKPLLPNSETIKEMMNELEKEAIAMKKSLDDFTEGGLVGLCDDILEFCNKYKYRATQIGE